MATTWATLFERAAREEATVADVRAALRRVRANGRDAGDADDAVTDPRTPAPTRVVADADVLAADLLVGGPSRDALDRLREHSWTTLVASDPLLADAEAVVRELADGALASDWRARVAAWREPVAHPAGDHPALASALRGGAMHVLALDEDLLSAGAGAAVRDRVETSVRPPDAFARLFDPASLYAHAVGGAYPGPDRDPRA
ncbi:MAG: hypothetical protein ABEJ61_10760 [Haloferacaceae archaeon]